MSAIVLTPLGKSIAENSQASGPESAVLSMLYEADSPLEVEEVTNEMRMDDEKAQMVLRRLINKGYIKEI